MQNQLGGYLLLATVALLAALHSYLWIRIVQKMGHKGWLYTFLTGLVSLFLYLSGYNFLVLMVFLALLAFGKWPVSKT